MNCASAGEAVATALGAEEIARYSRHLILPEVGMEGQLKLKRARVLLVGTGGLGSPMALYLTAAGVGTIGLVDFDVVDTSNLQRQVIHGTRDVGRKKLDSAEESMRDINPNVRVVRHETALTSGNALDIIRDYDIVADGTDNFPTRYLVNDACVKLGKPNVYGSILRFEGQLSVFYAKEGPCYRCMFPEPPPPGLVPNCAEAGVLGVLPGVIGTLQATEAIKLIAGIGDPMIGRMLLYDALELSFTTIKVRKNPACPVCGQGVDPAAIELIDYEQFCGVPAHDHHPASAVTGNGHLSDDIDLPVPQITARALKQRLDAGEDLFIVDVRNPEEFAIAALEGTLKLPKPQIMLAAEDILSGRRTLEDTVIAQIPRDREVIVHCRSGVRSTDVIYILRELGYDPQKLVNMEGGILAWAQTVDRTMPVY